MQRATNEKKRGGRSPSKLRIYLNDKAAELAAELDDIALELTELTPDEKTSEKYSEIHDRITIAIAQQKIVNEIKRICKERKEY